MRGRWNIELPSNSLKQQEISYSKDEILWTAGYLFFAPRSYRYGKRLQKKEGIN